MTKNDNKIIIRYFDSADYSLYHVYKTYSTAKAISFESILQEMRACNGYDMRILSHNSSFYTCAYRWQDSTGREWLVYHTAYNKRSILINA